jgi:tetratricopeptide (TPR) repeat protein
MFMDLSSKNPTALAHYKRAREAETLDLPTKADELTKAIELDPYFIEAYHMRGIVKDDLASFGLLKNPTMSAIVLQLNGGEEPVRVKEMRKSAIADFTKALECNPDALKCNLDLEVKIYTDRGVTYSNLKEYDLAISDHNKALELNSDFIFAYNGRGFAYLEKGEYDLAIADFNEALKRKPDFQPALFNLHRVRTIKEER